MLVALLLCAADKHSGYDDATASVRAMQDDDTANPGMLWVAQGETLWAQNCASCHGPPSSMRGVAPRYPRADGDRVVTLSEQINHQRPTPWPPESDETLSLAALLGYQSRGLPLAVDASHAQPALAKGRALFFQRMGQLDLSCADCHDTLAGHRLGGSRIPQGHPNGYPEYRLEWQTLGSLERRLHNCLTGMRAAPIPPADQSALEFYLSWRATGLPTETPAVRP